MKRCWIGAICQLAGVAFVIGALISLGILLNPWRKADKLSQLPEIYFPTSLLSSVGVAAAGLVTGYIVFRLGSHLKSKRRSGSPKPGSSGTFLLWGLILLAAGLVVAFLLIVPGRHGEPPPPDASAPPPEVLSAGNSALEITARAGDTNRPIRNGGTFRLAPGHLSDGELADLRATFENRLKPAVERWCKAYAGHVPFRPEALTLDNFSGAVGRGPRCTYMFVLDGMTLAIEDADRGVLFCHLNTPASKSLVQLPHGTSLDPSLPVTRQEIASMLKADAGIDLPPAEVRVKPTAFSSAMNGGAEVTVGGDPLNAASWKFTLVFGPDGNLTYYLRGH